MQPGANDADFVKPGVVYGYRAVCDYGDFSDGQGHVYYFGRSKQRCVLDLDLSGEDPSQAQKDMLRGKLRRTGLNSPSRILLWVGVADVDKAWDDFREQLRGWRPGWTREEIDGVLPIITHVVSLGDNYYTVENLGPEDFGTWCRAVMQRIAARRGGV